VSRPLVALLFAALASVAHGQDPWKWEPGKQRTPVVGYRYVSEGDVSNTQSSTLSAGGGAPQTTVKQIRTMFRMRIEVKAVEDGQLAQEHITIEKWMQKRGDDIDTSLEGQHVLVTYKDGGKSYVLLDDPDGSKVSKIGKGFLDGYYRADANPEKAKTQGEELEAILFPPGPKAPDESWAIDIEKASKLIPQAVDNVDPDGSTATGKLTDVKVVNGVHAGHREVSLKLKLKNYPGVKDAPWEDGGFYERTIAVDGSLELDKRDDNAVTRRESFGGRTIYSRPDKADPSLTVTYDFAVHQETVVKMKTTPVESSAEGH